VDAPRLHNFHKLLREAGRDGAGAPQRTAASVDPAAQEGSSAEEEEDDDAAPVEEREVLHFDTPSEYLLPGERTVSAAAVELDRGVRDLPGHLRREELRDERARHELLLFGHVHAGHHRLHRMVKDHQGQDK
jgi:hypothetical protein